jgi:hypothetical protein
MKSMNANSVNSFMQRGSQCSGKGHLLGSSSPGFNPWVLHNVWKNKKNSLAVPPHSSTCWTVVTVWANQGFVAVVTSPNNNAAQPGGCGSGLRHK